MLETCSDVPDRWHLPVTGECFSAVWSSGTTAGVLPHASHCCCRQPQAPLLQHSTTACFYFLPPHGRSKVDLVAMSALSQHVALLPVLSLPQGASEAQAGEVAETVQKVLQEPGAYVEGLQPIKMHK
jgi:hypothetical protein